jgi:hypothetical protein
MRIFYKTFVELKFNKYINNTKQFICVRIETVSATGNTIQESENAALECATSLMSSDPTIKISYQLKTIQVKSNLIFQ